MSQVRHKFAPQLYLFADPRTEYNKITKEFYNGTDVNGFNIVTFMKLRLHEKLGGSPKKEMELYFKKLVKDHLIYAVNDSHPNDHIEPHERIYFWTNLADMYFGGS